MTGEFIKLPEASKVEKSREKIDACLGFSRRTKQYKVIRIFTPYICGRKEYLYDDKVAEIYTLGTRSWRSVASPPDKYNSYGGKNINLISMGVLNGHLCICDAAEFGCVCIWAVKKHGVRESWSKVFSINTETEQRWPQGLYHPLKKFKNGAIMMSLKDAVMGDNVEVLNVKSRCAKFELREEVKPLILVEEISDLASDFYTSSEESC
ncbi:uncharacterized protein LOC133853948 [Alnus glutinosa]|uniref:uncharacterized protein LOC133853948 n=1 Tax=Alnus glutinosa TaxID=3517 RepID=UPI002D777099|nr:uncharacterized protein LOC133853948 [Alnus glutinosa]